MKVFINHLTDSMPYTESWEWDRQLCLEPGFVHEIGSKDSIEWVTESLVKFSPPSLRLGGWGQLGSMYLTLGREKQDCIRTNESYLFLDEGLDFENSGCYLTNNEALATHGSTKVGETWLCYWFDNSSKRILIRVGQILKKYWLSILLSTFIM